MSISYQDPFEEYKNRQEKKRARKAAEESKTPSELPSKKQDDTNWFGVKIGTEKSGSAGAGGVGKYLNLKTAKRPAESQVDAGAPQDEGKKKRKLGFGNFEGW